MAYTFGAKDILAILGLTAENWEVQESEDADLSDSAVVRDKIGTYIPASEVRYNKRTEKTLTIKAKTPDDTAEVSFKLGGKGTTNVVITQFNLKQSYNAHATLSVTAHVHSDVEAGAVHLDDTEVEINGLSVGFGALQNFLGGTDKDLQSVDLSGSVEHTDKLSNVGKFLVGASHGFKLECTQEYVDGGTAVTVASPWVQDEQRVKTSGGDSPDFYTRTVKAHCYDEGELAA